MERLKNDKGFTILEVVMAVSILTVGILAVASMQVSSIRGNAFAWGTSRACNVAMGQIEGLMDLSYEDAALTAGDHGPVTNDNYNITWSVLDDDLIEGTKTVRVTVRWRDHGINRDVSMSFTLGEIV